MRKFPKITAERSVWNILIAPCRPTLIVLSQRNIFILMICAHNLYYIDWLLRYYILNFIILPWHIKYDFSNFSFRFLHFQPFISHYLISNNCWTTEIKFRGWNRTETEIRTLYVFRRKTKTKQSQIKILSYKCICIHENILLIIHKSIYLSTKTLIHIFGMCMFLFLFQKPKESSTVISHLSQAFNNY